MQASRVIDALGALAHEHRLAIYRLLVEQGSEGLPAGAIGEGIGLVPSSLTFHLQNLQRAGLIAQRRESRHLIYSVDFDVMNDLVDYLTENCCASSGQRAQRTASPPGRRRASGEPKLHEVIDVKTLTISAKPARTGQ